MDSGHITVGQVVGRISQALWGVFVGDALNMPVHWYYNLEKLKADFGFLEYYADPKLEHPNSYMSLPKTEDPTQDIIGKHILFGKRDLYDKGTSHYHHGLKAGDNTLNALITKLGLEVINNNNGEFNADLWLDAYIKFMTTAGTHEDCYADGFHRSFITNYLQKKPLNECGQTSGSDIVAHKILIPALFAPLLQWIRENKLTADDKADVPKEIREKCINTALDYLHCHYKGEEPTKDAKIYASTLLHVVLGQDLRAAIVHSSEHFGVDIKKLVDDNTPDEEICGKKYSNSCSNKDGIPIIFFFSYKYSDDFDKAIQVDSNLGGDNINRGSAIGALVAAHNGNLKSDSKWITGLVRKDELSSIIGKFTAI